MPGFFVRQVQPERLRAPWPRDGGGSHQTGCSTASHPCRNCFFQPATLCRPL